MTDMKQFRQADYHWSVDEIENRAGHPLFKRVTLEWSRPQPLDVDENGRAHPRFGDDRPLLYAIMRNHQKMRSKNRICYIGLSTNPNIRFHNHPTAMKLAKKRGETTLSYAHLDEGASSDRLGSVRRTLEDIEHILIWVLWNEQSENDRKLFTLPGLGTTTGQALHIINTGFRFSGQMPRELVYPWTLVKRGRDRSQK